MKQIMESKYEQLENLKQLLDTGALTQEEFEVAKQRILDNAEVSVPNQENKSHVNATSKTTKNKKALIIGAVILVAIIIVICLISSKATSTPSVSNDETLDWAAAEAEAQAHMDEVLANCISEDSDEYFELHNRWHIQHFKNEWGEETDRGYIYTILSGTGWNMRIDYIPGDEQAPNGVFRFSIVDNEGFIEDMDGPANIIVREANKETYEVDVKGVQGSMAFVEDALSVEGLKQILDQGSFDILMEFEKYNERHRCQAKFEDTPGFFSRAETSML